MTVQRIELVRKTISVLFVILLVLMAYNIIMLFRPHSYSEWLAHSKPGLESPLQKDEQIAKKSFHDAGYEEAFIDSIDLKNDLVVVETVDTKMRIVFHPPRIGIKKFNKGWIAPVTFECSQRSGGKCDLSQPYKLYVSNMLVEPIKVE